MKQNILLSLEERKFGGRRVFTMCTGTWWQGVKEMDPGSLEEGRWVQCEIQGIPLNCKKNLFLLWGGSDTVTGCPVRFWSLLPQSCIQNLTGHTVVLLELSSEMGGWTRQSAGVPSPFSCSEMLRTIHHFSDLISGQCFSRQKGPPCGYMRSYHKNSLLCQVLRMLFWTHGLYSSRRTSELGEKAWLFSSLFMRNSVVFVFMYKSLPWPVGVPMCCGWSLHPTASCVTRVFGYYLYCFSLSFFFVPIFCLFFDINPIFKKCFLVPASFQNKSFAERSSFPHQFIVLFRTVAKGWGSGTWLRFLGINQETSRSYVCHV